MADNKTTLSSGVHVLSTKKKEKAITRPYPTQLFKCKGVLAFYNKLALGQILSASLSEISFFYWYNKETSFSGPFLPSHGTVDIISPTNDFWLCGLPVTIIFNSQKNTLQSPEYKVAEWFCSLKFGDIINDQKFKLKRFLATCAQNYSRRTLDR